jgi:hypothetical protein
MSSAQITKEQKIKKKNHHHHQNLHLYYEEHNKEQENYSFYALLFGDKVERKPTQSIRQNFVLKLYIQVLIGTILN